MVIDFCNVKDWSENLDLNAREWCCLHRSTVTVDLRQAKAQVVFTNFKFLFILDDPSMYFRVLLFYLDQPRGQMISHLANWFFFSLSLALSLSGCGKLVTGWSIYVILTTLFWSLFLLVVCCWLLKIRWLKILKEIR